MVVWMLSGYGRLMREMGGRRGKGRGWKERGYVINHLADNEYNRV